MSIKFLRPDWHKDLQIKIFSPGKIVSVGRSSSPRPMKGTWMTLLQLVMIYNYKLHQISWI